MAAIPAHLARDVDVRLDLRVSAVSYDGGWALRAENGDRFKARALLLTPPAPQSLALLDAGGVELPPETRQALTSIEYDPCLALLAVLDGPSRIPQPGGLWPGGETIAWMADNGQKGISTLPCVTIHAGPAFSRDYFDADEAQVARLLLDEARRWLGADVTTYRLIRWPYSIPTQLHHEPALFCARPGPLAFAGDAFAGPRVEGAALSGLAAAGVIADHL
jgi:predicted NAD/FAD-dependent oxidoreductase